MTIDTDIEQAKCELQTWENAHKAARDGSSYTIDGITVTRQDVETVIVPNQRRLRRTILQLQAAKNGAKAPSFRVANLRDTGA